MSKLKVLLLGIPRHLLRQILNREHCYTRRENENSAK